MSVFTRAVEVLARQRYQIKKYELLLASQLSEIEDLQRLLIEHQKAYIDLVAAWRLSLEHPDVDLAEDLDEMLCELRDNAAKTQEHFV